MSTTDVVRVWIPCEGKPVFEPQGLEDGLCKLFMLGAERVLAKTKEETSNYRKVDDAALSYAGNGMAPGTPVRYLEYRKG